MTNRIINWRELVDQVRHRLGVDPEVVEALNEIKGRLTTPIFSVEKKPCDSSRC